MSTYNVTIPMNPSRAQQVLVDEKVLAELQQELARRGTELDRLKAAMETLAAINTPARFLAAAMALCNELATRFSAERVGIGFLRNRYVCLQALSHTEKITRHMQLVQDIESAMEECLDQDIEVILPPVRDASYVSRSTEKLAQQHGPSAITSLPLRRDGAVLAVLTLERKADRPFAPGEIETLRLICDLMTARLADLYEQDKWIGAKAARETRKSLAWVVGTKHTWTKVIAIAVFALLAFALFVDGTYRVEAPFIVEPTERQVLSAPYDAILRTVNVQVGDLVFTPATRADFDALAAAPLVSLLPPRPSTVLATLDTSELLNRLAGALAEKDTAFQQEKMARREGIIKEAEAQMALAQAAKAQAQIDLLQWQIGHAAITAPIDGIIFAGDLKPKIGARVKVGDELFEVGRREGLRAELSVPEDQITELRINYPGELAASSYPGRKLNFIVERINPVAEVNQHHNVYKVRVRFVHSDVPQWLKPGMEGIARVDVGEARYAWLWTHKLVNWVRMKLWV